MLNIKIFELNKIKPENYIVENLFDIHMRTMLINDSLTKNCFFDEFFCSSNRIYVVAFNNFEPIGYLGIMLVENSADVIGVCVDLPYQKKGICSKMFRALVDFLYKTKCEKIYLEVDEKNSTAIEVYKKLGFKFTHLRKKYYKDSDAYCMCYDL